MKVLLVHNSYKQRGGEDRIVELQVSALKAAGCDVSLHNESNLKITGPISAARAAAGVIFSLRSFFRIRRLIRDYSPDVVHVHNFFPLISPSVFYATASTRVATVHTLHNYRIICPTATLTHDGNLQLRSIAEGTWWTVFKRIYRDSALGTLAVVIMIELHRALRTWGKIHRLVMVSAAQREIFIAAGFPSETSVVVPNFVPTAAFPGLITSRKGFLFVGRLVPEKGVLTLLAATALLQSEGIEITVVGDGPLRSKVENAPGIRYLGERSPSEVQKLMKEAVALIVPSTWYEPFGLVAIEAYATGTPVIASRIGALEEVVKNGETGLHFRPGDPNDLARAVLKAARHPSEMVEMGRNGCKVHQERYSPEAHTRLMLDVYWQAIAVARANP